MRPIPGDPLTGSVPALPSTRLVILQETLGPVRRRQPQRSSGWPLVPDPQAVTIRQLRTGAVAYVRTRWGVRAWVVRTVNRSREVHNKGRHFFTGMDRSGRCHSAWVDQVVSVQSIQAALAAGKVIDVRS